MMFIAVRLHTNSITIVSVPDDTHNRNRELSEIIFRQFGSINVKALKTATEGDVVWFRAMGGNIYNIE